MAEHIKIEVAYALPDNHSLLTIDIAVGTTIEDAIKQSGILERHPEIDLAENKVGIWSRMGKLKEPVRDGDRIEIYRPLIADPKEVRKRRAERAKEEGRADKITGGRPNPRKKTDVDAGE